MTFLKRLGNIIIESLTPSKPEEFIGVVEEITRSTLSNGNTECTFYYHILYIDNKGDRRVSNTGYDVGLTRSTIATQHRMEVEAWLKHGPLPKRLNIDHNGDILVGIGNNIVKKSTPKKQPELPKVEKDGNLIKFPGNKDTNTDKEK